jgi:tripeptidyl-peptidase-1
LDTQWILSLAENAESTYHYVDWTPFTNPFLRYVRDLANTRNIADVHSISYLYGEEEVHPLTQQLFNDEVCKLGLRGVTVVVSSGDEGAPGQVGCNYGGKKHCKLSASFPANSPFVTTVGATMGPEKGPEEEVACQTVSSPWEINSGGGFSEIFPRPAYQYRPVKKYLQSSNDYEDSGDAATWGRAYPDVSMLGKNYEMYLLGQPAVISGTSGSAPAFASLIALINSKRAENGLKKLGFLNPVLYSKIMDGAYNDITKGHNKCCMGQVGEGQCCPHGWVAAPGWDPVTGLGSPDITKWLDILGNDFIKDHHDNTPIP